MTLQKSASLTPGGLPLLLLILQPLLDSRIPTARMQMLVAVRGAARRPLGCVQPHPATETPLAQKRTTAQTATMCVCVGVCTWRHCAKCAILVFVACLHQLSHTGITRIAGGQTQCSSLGRPNNTSASLTQTPALQLCLLMVAMTHRSVTLCSALPVHDAVPSAGQECAVCSAGGGLHRKQVPWTCPLHPCSRLRPLGGCYMLFPWSVGQLEGVTEQFAQHTVCLQRAFPLHIPPLVTTWPLHTSPLPPLSLCIKLHQQDVLTGHSTFQNTHSICCIQLALCGVDLHKNLRL